MIRTRSPAHLDPWLECAKSSLVASFANGVVKDKAAVSAAVALPWSNGPTEGPDHQAEACQTPDVRAHKSRPPASPRCRSRLTAHVIKIASEPRLRAACSHASATRSVPGASEAAAGIGPALESSSSRRRTKPARVRAATDTAPRYRAASRQTEDLWRA
jgi:hypothetical protein